MLDLVPGLVSVTFRTLSPAEIIALAVHAGVMQMEWGGDVHVPPGQIDVAREVGTRTQDAGLAVASYGSYYRAGSISSGPEFERCLDSATALGAPLIRVWAGDRGAAEADPHIRERVLQDTRRICRLAAERGLAVAFEFHAGTLIDSAAAAADLLGCESLPNLRTLWQPLGSASPAARMAEVQRVLPWLAHIHIYHWPGGQRVPLADGEREWIASLSVVARAGRPVGLFLEFVQDDSPEQFIADAATLQRWILRLLEPGTDIDNDSGL
jgi:3-dehydroshikimate dehydratase